MTSPLADPLAEARRLNQLADAAGITARLLGGVAVALSAEETPPAAGAIAARIVLPAALRREYKDLDYVVPSAHAPAWSHLLEAAGYQGDREFNTLHGAQRLLHVDEINARQLDTFVATFSMCHTLELENRLPVHSHALAPEDLLLTKLQIVEVNDKDLIDTIALLLTHAVDDSPTGISPQRLGEVVGRDWGWYTTLQDNLGKVRARLAGAANGFDLALEAAQKRLVLERLERLDAILIATPKSMKWRLRSRIGRRLPWYELPEEVD